MTTVEYLLGLGDDALVEAQRLAAWCARAPEMEEDVALANIALDQLGAARLLLGYAGELEGLGRDEDALAYLRDDRDYRNVLLVELPDADFGTMIAKLLFLSAYQVPLYRRLSTGEDARLAGIAAKAVKESAYHLDHASLWTVRLGDGTDESRRRMQAAVDELWPYSHELFGWHGDLRDGWLSTVDGVLAEATLRRPAGGCRTSPAADSASVAGWQPRGGRAGRHTEHLSYLLGEMQVLHRAHPGARW